MSKEKKLSIHTEKNWAFAFYLTFVGGLFLFISTSLFVHGDANWLGNFILTVLFIFGVLSLFSL